MIEAISRKILDISLALSSEKDDETLLELILTSAMDIAGCDAGTLYIKRDDKLYFKIMITQSMGGRLDSDNLPPVELTRQNICAKALLDNTLINISNVQDNDYSGHEGAKRYDAMTGYVTRSMLVVPMIDKENHEIGVVQLINAMNSDGEAVPFSEEQEVYISALSSLAATCLVKMGQALEIKGLLNSLVRALSTAIYKRTPYNVNHTRNMVQYTEKFLSWLDTHRPELAFSEDDKKQFIMSVWLHDVGKLTVPIEVMNKSSRLGDALERVLTRLDIIELTAKLDEAKNGIPFEQMAQKLERAREIIIEANTVGRMNDDILDEIEEIAQRTYIDLQGRTRNWLTSSELTSLSITTGTLTMEERYVMQSHVVMTESILGQVSFGSNYMMVKKWASEHHELLDGSGYPKQLKGDELCKETRILTIIDIFDGLAAKDRPYKPMIKLEKALVILRSMAHEGKLDSHLLETFIESKAWEGIL